MSLDKEKFYASLMTSRETASTSFRATNQTGKGKFHNYLVSLQNMQSLKQNPKAHNMPYSQLSQLRATTSSFEMSPKKSPRIKRLKPTPREEYSSLNPDFLQTHTSERHKKSHLPGEKRQIFMDQYFNQANSARMRTPSRTFDSIWHQTLSSRSIDNNMSASFEKEAYKSNLNNSSNKIQLFSVPTNETKETGSNSGLTQQSTTLEEQQKLSLATSSVEEYKAVTPEQLEIKNKYLNVQKEVKVMEEIQKDFTKIMSNVQKTYEKAEEKQKELHNFAIMFATEIAQLERFPKESKTSRLSSCLQMVVKKADELKEAEELIKDQILYIEGLLQAEPKSPTSVDSPTSDSVSFDTVLAKSPSPNLSPEKRHSLLVNPRVTTPNTARKSLNYTQNKTEELRLDVQKLKEERNQFIVSTRKGERSGSKGEKKEFTLKKWSVNNPKDESPVAQEYELSKGTLIKSGSLTDRTPRKSQELLVATKVVTFVKKLKGRKSDLKEEPPKPWDSALNLYSVFRKFIDELEETLRKNVVQMKVLKKDVDDDREKEDASQGINEQIRQIYEKTKEQIHRNLHAIGAYKVLFLTEVSEHFTGLQNLSKSNMLKMESLRNMIEESIKKVKQTESFGKKYTAFDLEDKTVRQKYNTRYEELKGDLSANHKTLLFLSEQFNLSIEAYKLCPLTQVTSQNIAELKSQFETVSKVLFYLQNFSELETEYNEKTSKAYKAIKNAESTKEFIEDTYEDADADTAQKIRDGEEPISTLKGLKVKMLALRNKLEVMCKVNILKEIVDKPLIVTVKLIKKIDISEKSLEKLLRNVQEKITGDYTDLVGQAMEIEKQVNSHTNRLLTAKEHLKFTGWSQNATIMHTLAADIDALDQKIEKFCEEEYPSRVILLPKPQQKREALHMLKKGVEAVQKTLAIGNLFTQENFFSCFVNIKSSNLKGKLEKMFVCAQKEIQEKEQILQELDPEPSPIRKMVTETLQFLTHLRAILKRSFDLYEKLSQEYLSFQGERLEDDPYLKNTTKILDNNRDYYPQIITSVSIVNTEKQNSAPNGQPSAGLTSAGLAHSIVLEENENAGSESLMPSPRSPHKMMVSSTCTLPALQNPEKSLSKLDVFISRLKKVLKDFTEGQISTYKGEHAIFKHIYDCFHEMSSNEVDCMERVRSAVSSAQVNQIFFNKEVKPLTQLYKCIDTLPMWDAKMENLLIVKHNMNDTNTMLAGFVGDLNIRGGVEPQIAKYQYTQKIVTTSMDVLTEILSLGRIFNEKDLKPHLTPQLRVEGTILETFLRLLDRKVEKIMEMYTSNSLYIEQDTATLTDKMSEFIKILTALLRATQKTYAQVMKKIINGPKSTEKGFVDFLDNLYVTVKGLADMFCDNVNRLARMTIKSTWVVKLLDDFYKDTILKDLSFFSDLLTSGKEVNAFLEDFRQNFIQIEIKQKTQYRKVAESNPTKCDWKVKKATEFAQTLNFLAHSEELMVRPQLKHLLITKHKELLMVKKVFANFALIYSMGRKLSDKVDEVLVAKHGPLVILQRIPEVEATLQDMIRHLDKIAVESKTSIKNTEIGIELNISDIIKEEILEFYIELNAWFGQLKINLLKDVQFYADLNRNFKGQVLLLRKDWVSFIKDWLTNSSIDLLRDSNRLHNNYSDFKERLNGYLTEIQKTIVAQQNGLKNILVNVEYLNENFFQDWFFDFTAEKSFNDVILMKISKTLEKINNEKYDLDSLKQKIAKLVDNVSKCDKTIRELTVEENQPTIFEGGIKDWEYVQQYYKNKKIRAWLSVIMFVQNEMLAQVGDSVMEKQFKEKVQTTEGLYLYVEQTTKYSLNPMLREFLASVYQWLKKNVLMN